MALVGLHLYTASWSHLRMKVAAVALTRYRSALFDNFKTQQTPFAQTLQQRSYNMDNSPQPPQMRWPQASQCLNAATKKHSSQKVSLHGLTRR
mmetsp:Transcript_7669/g.14020  ORF Transcript_7669/g.14020 Transcript_7669/m.14020 type:complete len:93 (+) Transcript_7669:1089-1367(+)